MITRRNGLLALALGISVVSAMGHDTRVRRGQFVTFGPSDNIRNLIIEGGKAELNGTYVRGSVTVKKGGELIANGALIAGNVEGDGAARISLLDGTYAYRNVKVEDSRGVFEIYASSISGSVSLKDNEFEWVDIYLSDIYNKLEISKNSLYDWVVVERIYQGGKQDIKKNDAFGILVSCNGSFDDIKVSDNYTEAETAFEFNLGKEDVVVEENYSAGLIFEWNELCRDADLEDNKSSADILVNENWVLFGTLKLEDNSAPNIGVGTNLIGHNLELEANRATGSIQVTANEIDRNLKCKKNRPHPSHEGNTVGGRIECELSGDGGDHTTGSHSHSSTSKTTTDGDRDDDDDRSDD